LHDSQRIQAGDPLTPCSKPTSTAVLTYLVDDAREEERERIERAIRTSVQEHAKPDLPVQERLPDHTQLQALSRGRELVVRLQTADNDGALLSGQELGGVREVLDDPERQDAGDDGGEPFEDEDPRPGGLAANSVHIGDAEGEQATEGTRDRGGGEEDRGANTKLGALVPAVGGTRD
jgi:hypothetical protein